MTPSVLAVNLGLSFLAMAGFCLSMNRHHQDVFGVRAERGRVLVLRGLAWAGIALSLLAAGHYDGWAIGPVQWIGALTLASLVLVLLLSYQPRAVAPSALLALLIAVLGLGSRL